jgi:hypothetical protein
MVRARCTPRLGCSARCGEAGSAPARPRCQSRSPVYGTSRSRSPWRSAVRQPGGSSGCLNAPDLTADVIPMARLRRGRTSQIAHSSPPPARAAAVEAPRARCAPVAVPHQRSRTVSSGNGSIGLAAPATGGIVHDDGRSPVRGRRGGDSNPRWTVSPYRFSRPAHSTALPPLRGELA